MNSVKNNLYSPQIGAIGKNIMSKLLNLKLCLIGGGAVGQETVKCISLPRHPLEFIVWNHVFMAWSVVRAWCMRRTGLVAAGSATTTLSVLYHLSRERHWQPIEGNFAKGTIAYLTYLTVRDLSVFKATTLLFVKTVTLLLWVFENRRYEHMHPWIHVLVAIDGHLYLTWSEEERQRSNGDTACIDNASDRDPPR